MKIMPVMLLTFLLAVAITATAQNHTHRSKDAVDPALSGQGTKNYLPVWLSQTELGDSKIFQKGGMIGIGTTTPAAKLDVNGPINATKFNIGGKIFSFGSYTAQNAFSGFAGNTKVAGPSNTAFGYQALASNVGDLQGDGAHNTAIGSGALFTNNDAGGTGTKAQDNTAIGYTALHSNINADQNTATGFESLYHTTTGSANTANGAAAAFNNTTGAINVAIGAYSLGANTSGSENTAIGASTLVYNTTGNFNTAIGYGAGPDQNSANLTNATAIGATATVSESNSIVLGGTGDFAVKVGIGTSTPSNVFTIAHNSGQAIADGWSTYSSRRWKTGIQTLQGALATIEQLRGVSYIVKDSGKREIGVIAEEVGAVVPEVVSWEKNGSDAQGVDYGRLTALLIEATKQQQAQIQKQQDQLQAQQDEIAKLTSQVQAVRAQRKNTRAVPEIRTVTAPAGALRQ
jgi:hypothetical protein